MIGSENENELGLDNVAGNRERSQFGGSAEIRAEDGGWESGIRVRARAGVRVRAGLELATLAFPVGRAEGGDQGGGRRAEDWRKNGDREYEYEHEYEYDSS